MFDSRNSSAPHEAPPNPNLEAALAYAAEGIPVFPCHSIVDGACTCGTDCGKDAGKHPRTKQGHTDASTDPGQIRAWWEQWPKANVGGVMGCELPSGGYLVAVDMDPRNDGKRALEYLQTEGMPLTRTHFTGGNGGHYFYRSSKRLTKGKLFRDDEPWRGIDIQATGSYVILPPSNHKSGGSYRVVDARPFDSVPALPEHIAQRRRKVAEASAGPVPVDINSERGQKRIAMAIDACKTFPSSCNDGESGSRRMGIVSHLKWELELPKDIGVNLVLEHWNTRCHKSPTDMTPDPWTDKKISKSWDESSRPKGWSSSIGSEEWAESFGKAARAANNTQDDDEDDDIQIHWGGWDQRPEDKEFLVDGLIPRDSVGAIFGHADTTKTWITLSLAIAVAKGEKWLGRYPTKQGKVLIVDFETGKNSLKWRLYKLGAGNNPSIGACFFPKKKPNTIAFWEAICKAAPDVDLIIVDSLRRANPGKNENDSEESIVPLEMAAEYTENIRPGVSVVFIHHAKKGTDGWPEMRGSSAIKDQADYVFAVRKDEAASSDVAIKSDIRCDKPGDMRLPAPFAVVTNFDDAELRATVALVEGEQAERTPVAAASSPQPVAESDPLEVLRSHAATGTRFRRLTDWKAGCGAGWASNRNKKFESYVKGLIKDRCVVNWQGEYLEDSAAFRAQRAELVVKQAIARNESLTAQQLADRALVSTDEILGVEDRGIAHRNKRVMGSTTWLPGTI